MLIICYIKTNYLNFLLYYLELIGFISTDNFEGMRNVLDEHLNRAAVHSAFWYLSGEAISRRVKERERLSELRDQISKNMAWVIMRESVEKLNPLENNYVQ